MLRLYEVVKGVSFLVAFAYLKISCYIYNKYKFAYITTLDVFFKMSNIKIKQKDIHKISVIFRLFTNLLRTEFNSNLFMY